MLLVSRLRLLGLASRSNGNETCPVAPEEGHRRPRSFRRASFARPERVDTKTPSYAHARDTTPPPSAYENHLRAKRTPRDEHTRRRIEDACVHLEHRNKLIRRVSNFKDNANSTNRRSASSSRPRRRVHMPRTCVRNNLERTCHAHSRRTYRRFVDVYESNPIGK